MCVGAGPAEPLSVCCCGPRPGVSVLSARAHGVARALSACAACQGARVHISRLWLEPSRFAVEAG
eukprot:15481914-Alexandrium_andersonii.AAC.1